VRNGGNVLVIPMRNISGEVLSCQFINEEGGKAYMRGSKRKGGFYTIKGEGKCVWICEGFATGASLHQDSGNSVLVAFDSGGLMAVTGAVIAAYGTSREFIIMADDDWKTSGNPGLSKAKAAAQTHGIKVRMPDFTGLDRGDKHTDYNDMAVLKHG
jgi:putative DNA primase/helicase